MKKRKWNVCLKFEAEFYEVEAESEEEAFYQVLDDALSEAMYGNGKNWEYEATPHEDGDLEDAEV